MFFKGLLYCLTLLPLGILAALDDKVKLANRTIDRVSSYAYLCEEPACCKGREVRDTRPDGLWALELRPAGTATCGFLAEHSYTLLERAMYEGVPLCHVVQDSLAW